MSESKRQVPLFTAGGMQISCQAVNGRTKEEAIEIRKQTLAKIRNYVSVNKMFVQFYNGSDVKVMVLPEYILSGFLLGESHQEWHDKACIEFDGFEYEELGKIAQDNNLYLSGNVYEIDPNFPDIYFQTCFIIAPNGNVELRYRRLTSAFEMTPHDVLDKYLDVYGVEGLRVCDASLMPDAVRANLQFTVYMMAEKIAAVLRHKGDLAAALKEAAAV